MGKYDPPDSYPPPKEKRTIQLYGEGDDEGKYFRCWNCGQICNKDRDTLGPGTGLTILDNVEPVYNVSGQGVNAVTLVLRDNHRMHKLTLDGSYEPVVHYNYSQVSGGCPFCGSKNYA